jgi:hypothetical protein
MIYVRGRVRTKLWRVTTHRFWTKATRSTRLNDTRENRTLHMHDYLRIIIIYASILAEESHNNNENNNINVWWHGIGPSPICLLRPPPHNLWSTQGSYYARWNEQRTRSIYVFYARNDDGAASKTCARAAGFDGNVCHPTRSHTIVDAVANAAAGADTVSEPMRGEPRRPCHINVERFARIAPISRGRVKERERERNR